MKKSIFGVMFLALLLLLPVSARAGVDIDISFSLPSVLVFSTPPEVIIMPDTNDVYFVPDIEIDLFFWNGWWWCTRDGGWYRSRAYNGRWAYHDEIPQFYFHVDPNWRLYYQSHKWNGHRWNYRRIDNMSVQNNWRSWNVTQHWERNGTWGVKNYKPISVKEREVLIRERQQQHYARPEVQKHQEYQKERKIQQEKPRVQRQEQPRVQEPVEQKQEKKVRKPQVQQQKVQKQRPKVQQQKEESDHGQHNQSQERDNSGKSGHENQGHGNKR